MSSSLATASGAITRRAPAARIASRQRVLRALLLAGCVAAVAAAAWLGQPAASMLADPELARLMRGMALIKAGIVLVALVALLWRFGLPISRRVAVTYLVGAWMLAGASMLVWQLTLIPLAAIGFHAGELALLVVAWRDHGARRDRRRSPIGKAL